MQKGKEKFEILPLYIVTFSQTLASSITHGTL